MAAAARPRRFTGGGLALVALLSLAVAASDGAAPGGPAAAVWASAGTFAPAACPFPAPPPGAALGAYCERVFAYRAETPCARGNHSSLCIALPTRRLSKALYDAKAERLKEPLVRLQIVANRIYIVTSSMPKIGSKVRRAAAGARRRHRRAGARAARLVWMFRSSLHPRAHTPPRAQYHRILLRHLRHIAGAASLHALPDVDFLLNVGDGSPPWPAFAHNSPRRKRGTPAQTFHVPTDTGVNHETPPPAATGCAPPSRAERARWAAMEDRLVFRGSATGTPVAQERWLGNMRARLSALGRLWPDVLDVKLCAPEGGVAGCSRSPALFASEAHVLSCSVSRFLTLAHISSRIHTHAVPHAASRTARRCSRRTPRSARASAPSSRWARRCRCATSRDTVTSRTATATRRPTGSARCCTRARSSSSRRSTTSS
jgi:hypothetical protein